MGGAGEDIHLVAELHIHEAGLPQDPPPLCFQQSAGNSTRPEFDVVTGILWHFDLDVDIGDLEASAGT